MSTPTDRERLAHFAQLIGAEPRQAEMQIDLHLQNSKPLRLFAR